MSCMSPKALQWNLLLITYYSINLLLITYNFTVFHDPLFLSEFIVAKQLAILKQVSCIKFDKIHAKSLTYYVVMYKTLPHSGVTLFSTQK